MATAGAADVVGSAQHQIVPRRDCLRRTPRSPGAIAQGKLTTLTGTVPEGVVAPVLLITCVMTPRKLSDTVSTSWNSTPAAVGTSNACVATTEGLTLKKQ